jgi:hypothetical protein
MARARELSETEAMGSKERVCCAYCGDPIDPASEFGFLVDAQIYLERVAPFEPVTNSFQVGGRPELICKECRASIDENRLDREQDEMREQARSRIHRRIWAGGGIVVLLLILAESLWNLWRKIAAEARGT